MDIEYDMKLQNAYGTKNKREKNIAKINGKVNKNHSFLRICITYYCNGGD